MTIVAVRPFRFAGADVAPGAVVRGANGEQLSAKLFGQLTRRHWIRVVDGEVLDESPTMPADLGPTVEALLQPAMDEEAQRLAIEAEIDAERASIQAEQEQAARRPNVNKVTKPGTARRRTQE